MNIFRSILLIGTIATVAAASKGWKLPAETAQLKAGPGAEVATANCILCHSVDYISTQPPLSRAAWTATVTKMKDKYGAPVTTNSIPVLVEYLTKTYGTERVAK